MISNEKVILFDLDDTLILEKKSMDDALYSTCSFCSKFINIDPLSLKYTVKETARDLWHQLPTYQYCLKIGVSSWEGLWANFLGEAKETKELYEFKNYFQINSWKIALQKYGSNNDELAHILSNKLNIERRKRHVLFPDTLPCLKELKKHYKLGIITNGLSCLQMEKIEGCNLKQYFDNIIIAGEVGVAKPDSRIFYEALSKFKTEKKQAIMIGNSLETDILGAIDFGMNAILINRGNEEIRNNLYYEISSLDYLPYVLKSSTFNFF